jgi:hypothetical protein
MTALFYAFGSETLALLLAPPDWNSGPVTVELTLPTDTSRSQMSTVESRRAFAASTRYSLGYSAYLDNAAAALELRIWLQRLKGETVAVPMWTDAVELAQVVLAGTTVFFKTAPMPVRYGAQWIIMNDAASVFELVSISALTGTGVTLTSGVVNAWPNGTLMYPLLFGRLSERPKAEAITDETQVVPLKIKENSYFARRLFPPGTSLPTVGAQIPVFADTPLWDIEPNFSKPVIWTEADIEFFDIGFGRISQQHIYPSANPRGMEHEFWQSGRDQIVRIERFFRDRRGPVLPFMIQTFLGEMRLTQDLPIAGNNRLITVETPNEFTDPARPEEPGDPYVALVDDNGVDPHKLGAVSGGNLPTIAPITRAHDKDETNLCALLYCRLTEPKLTWTYTTDDQATTKLKFLELVNEYITVPAALPEPVYLFIFSEQTITITRFTSYESGIVLASGAYAGTYPPAPFSFGTARHGSKLDDKIELTSFPFTGNPLAKFFPFAFDGILSLLILEVDAADLTAAPVLRFSGDVNEVDPIAYTAQCSFLGRFLERKYPAFLLSATDNYTQFTLPTGISAAAFAITGTIGAFSGVSNETINVDGAAAAAKPAQWFAEGGYLDTGGGANRENRAILHSTPYAGGVQIVIDRPLLKAALGQSATMYPGYDGSIDECDAKFNNRINFGGHPFVPDTNPMVKAMKAKEPAAGKKG